MKKKQIVAVIPARMGSSRFPGKPLAPILGKAMIFHVYQRAKLSKLLSEVYIATCDKEIYDYCQKEKMNVVMTKDTHERASDRAAEAMIKIERKLKKKTDILLMLQGDEPMVTPLMIKKAITPLIQDKKVLVTNLVSMIASEKEFKDPNEVKVVLDKIGNALYFSREAIPSFSKYGKHKHCMKQVCVIPYQRDFLLKFNRMKQTPLEIIESIDMMRCLENGYQVKMISSKEESYSVDTLQDLKKVQKEMKTDKLVQKYM